MFTVRMLPLCCSLLCLSLTGFGQNYFSDFKKMAADADTAGQVRLLTKWEAAQPTNPDLFIAYYNYYVNKAKQELISLEQEQHGEQSLQIQDTGDGHAVGYLNARTVYNPDYSTKALSYIDKGIKLYPDRLDMRFGKVYFLGQMEDYESFTQAIVQCIDYNAKLSSKWKWTDNEPVEDGKDFFLSTIQGYIKTLYDAGDGQLPNMRVVSEAVLKYYPDNVESLSNVAITYLLISEYDKALGYLLKAEHADPKDGIVLNNIAETYARKKDLDKSAVYYHRVIELGDGEMADFAKEQLKKIGRE